MSFIIGALLLGAITSMTTALSGFLMVIRRDSMIIDAMGHAVLPGIVFGFWLSGDLHSFEVFIGAVMASVSVAVGSDLLKSTRLIGGDAHIALLFPALLSIGIVAISLWYHDIHLDTTAVLIGDLNLVALDQITFDQTKIGPRYFYGMLLMFLFMSFMLFVFKKQLFAVSFDQQLSGLLGLKVRLIKAFTMGVVAVVTTMAFNALGAILVVAVAVTPVSIAILYANSFHQVLIHSVVIAGFASIVDFVIAYQFDAPTSATIACILGVAFMMSVVANRWTQKSKMRSFAQG